MKKMKMIPVAFMLLAGVAGTSANAQSVLDLSTASVFAESEQFPGSRPAEQAFDGSIASGAAWVSTDSQSDPQWIYVDLGGTYDITQIRIAHEATLNHAVSYDLYVFEGLSAPDPETSLGSWTSIGTASGRSSDAVNSNFDESWDFVGGSTTTLNGTGTLTVNQSGTSGVRADFLLFNGQNTNATGFYRVGVTEIEVTASVIPEPSTFVLMAIALCGLVFVRRKK